jgi:DNA-binding response OmpR family regulator
MADVDGRNERNERKCVAWVDDDPSLRRLVALALEDLPIDLHLLSDAVAARALLQNTPVDLLVTDLMLPGESGLSLLASLAQILPSTLRQPKVMVFSARNDLPNSAVSQLYGVSRVLVKPIPMQSLRACVTEALAAPDEAADEAASASVPRPDQARVVAEMFGGQTTLYETYLASCRQQLPLDLAAGDAALAKGNLAGLLHVVHNIKGVLNGLGYRAGGQLAATLEEALMSALPPAGPEETPLLHPVALQQAWAAVTAAVLDGPLNSA